MKVILLEDVGNLGRAGEVVEAKEGYFRNYLLPRKWAVPSTTGGLRFLEAKKRQALQKSESLKKEALRLAAKLSETPCLIKAKVGQEGKLFGSVTTHDVCEALEKKGIAIERKRIEMVPIHQIGEHHAKVKLHPEVDVALKVVVSAER